MAGAAAEIAALPLVVGLLAEDGIDWVVADLAASAAGKTLVPIPAFFSRDQISHLIADAGVAHVLTDSRLRALVHSMGVPCGEIPRREESVIPKIPGASRVIYTSGSTGTPKGVRLAGGQIAHSVMALAAASGASADDLHLSVLPFPLLLEQICGIYLVIHAGATCHVAVGAAERCAKGDAGLLVQSCEEARPTTSVLVPELLAALVAGYAKFGKAAPDSLRFVAVGGAPVPDQLLEAAWRAGIPACVGYGLSECCSVVTLGPPGGRSTTAGKPLPGIGVEIDHGEIVVSGPTVMLGYLGGEDPRGRWRTGDMGRLDHDGNLVVLGRKDNLLVIPNGRNVSPEWVEAMIERDSRIGRCIVVRGNDGDLTAVVTLATAADTDTPSTGFNVAAIVFEATRGAPAYARPTACMTTSEDFLAREGLLNGKGEPRRAALAQRFDGTSNTRRTIEVPVESNNPMSNYEHLLFETSAEREAFLAIPIIREALRNGVDRDLYLAYLCDAYHHVKHTCPLLALAVARCQAGDGRLRDALLEYIAEEHGHDEWILDDIGALGGDAEAIRVARGGPAVRIMVGYAYFAIEWISPYTLLGMVHVLESVSATIASQAARSIRARISESGGKGFSYLESHGSLDQEHVKFFEGLLNGIEAPETRDTIIESAKIMYRLFGDVFKDQEARFGSSKDAA